MERYWTCGAAVLITSNCRKCIFQESGQSVFVKSGYVHCFGRRTGVKENFGNVLEIMFYKSGPVDMKPLNNNNNTSRREEFD